MRRGWAALSVLTRLYVKDEGLNPTGSFKARGMTAAVTRAKQLGAKALGRAYSGECGWGTGGLRGGGGIAARDRDAGGYS